MAAPRPMPTAIATLVQPLRSSHPNAWSSEISPGPIAGDRGSGDRDHDHVFDALTLAEDKEPVEAVVDPHRHRHEADDPGGGEGSEQSGGEQQTGSELGRAREAGLQPPVAHPHALEPSRRPRELPTAEQLVQAVSHHREPDRRPQHEQTDVSGFHGERLSRAVTLGRIGLSACKAAAAGA